MRVSAVPLAAAAAVIGLGFTAAPASAVNVTPSGKRTIQPRSTFVPAAPVPAGTADQAECQRLIATVPVYKPAGVQMDIACISAAQMEKELPGAGGYTAFPPMWESSGYDDHRTPAGTFKIRLRNDQGTNYLESTIVHEWAHVESSLWSNHERDLFMKKAGNVSPGWSGYPMSDWWGYLKSGTEMYSRTAEKCTYPRTYSTFVADCGLFADIRINAWARVSWSNRYGKAQDASVAPKGAGNSANEPGIEYCYGSCAAANALRTVPRR